MWCVRRTHTCKRADEKIDPSLDPALTGIAGQRGIHSLGLLPSSAPARGSCSRQRRLSLVLHLFAFTDIRYDSHPTIY
jgi:hypothetical protein